MGYRVKIKILTRVQGRQPQLVIFRQSLVLANYYALKKLKYLLYVLFFFDMIWKVIDVDFHVNFYNYLPT